MATPSSISPVTAPRTPRNRLHRFYRGTLFQCIIAGVVSFANPGIWNALNGKEGIVLWHLVLLDY